MSPPDPSSPSRDTGTAEVWTLRVCAKCGRADAMGGWGGGCVDGPLHDPVEAKVVRSEWKTVAEELAERLRSQMVGWEPGRECDCKDCVLFARFDSLTKEKADG